MSGVEVGGVYFGSTGIVESRCSSQTELELTIDPPQGSNSLMSPRPTSFLTLSQLASIKIPPKITCVSEKLRPTCPRGKCQF